MTGGGFEQAYQDEANAGVAASTVPYRQTFHGNEDEEIDEPLGEIFGKGEISTLPMTETQLREARKRERTRVVGFAPEAPGATRSARKRP